MSFEQPKQIFFYLYSLFLMSFISLSGQTLKVWKFNSERQS